MRLLDLVVASAITLCSTPLAAQGLGQGTPDAPITEWATTDPDSLGLSLAVLDAHLDLCERSKADGCLVAYRGQVVQEWYGPNYALPLVSGGLERSMRSVGKSVAALLAGMLVGDGALSVDDPVSEWIPEWEAGADSAVTVRHLLTMTAGLPRAFGCPDTAPGCTDDYTAYALSLPLAHSPGERMVYSNEGAQLLSPILERAAGMPLHEYARTRLFEPLGFDSTSLGTDASGNTSTVGGPRTTLREAAALGQLVANGGVWNGEQVVPAEWIEAVRQPNEAYPYYGMLWWVDEGTGTFFAAGDLDNVIAVYPDDDLVVVRAQFTPDPRAEVQYFGPSTFHLLRGVVENRLQPQQE
ncbi:serine hydrolase [Rubrivirga sp. S365]|uniref:serine hydrolase domain-containing protein n=1 Tax=Rubrivirga sp. S365 TaxID=3076080 RepID=UPI0028C55C0D|nr:serine hydrolase [Rubrivirga sp. S365]MDT7858146.1 serine hydrolase [Rubrivirga sp. S365]